MTPVKILTISLLNSQKPHLQQAETLLCHMELDALLSTVLKNCGVLINVPIKSLCKIKGARPMA